jgi:spore coat protein U-like protein
LAKLSFADCNNLRVNAGSSSVDLTPNTAPALNLTVQRAGNHGCDFFVTVDYGGAPTYSSRRLSLGGGYEMPVNIYRDAAHTQILKKLPDATQVSEVITGSFPDGTNNPSSQTLTYYPSLGALGYNRFGSYSDTYTFRIYNGTPGSGNPGVEDTDTLSLKYTMSRKIDLSLLATGEPFNAADTTENLNFGNLAAGAVRTFDIGLKYNAGYRVKVSSANQGKLQHTSQNDTVPYTLRVNSSAVNLTGSNTNPVQVATGSGVSPANGLILTSSVTIGALGSARAGNYSDTVTVTVSTTE